MQEWLTYNELAERFGSSPEAMRQRSLRGQWRRQTNNDGKTIVLVPEDVLVRPRKKKVRVKETGVEQPKQTSSNKDLERIIAVLESHIGKLEKELSFARESLVEERKIALESLTAFKNLTAELANMRATTPVVPTRQQADSMAEIIQRMKEKAAARIVAA